jgi:hypothetical protein
MIYNNCIKTIITDYRCGDDGDDDSNCTTERCSAALGPRVTSISCGPRPRRGRLHVRSRATPTEKNQYVLLAANDFSLSPCMHTFAKLILEFGKKKVYCG